MNKDGNIRKQLLFSIQGLIEKLLLDPLESEERKLWILQEVKRIAAEENEGGRRAV